MYHDNRKLLHYYIPKYVCGVQYGCIIIIIIIIIIIYCLLFYFCFVYCPLLFVFVCCAVSVIGHLAVDWAH
jgi:hypothetical protein